MNFNSKVYYYSVYLEVVGHAVHMSLDYYSVYMEGVGRVVHMNLHHSVYMGVMLCILAWNLHLWSELYPSTFEFWQLS